MGIDQKDVMCVKIAALCHDLGHGPFSHLFEEVIKKIHMMRHPEVSAQEAKKFFQVSFITSLFLFFVLFCFVSYLMNTLF